MGLLNHLFGNLKGLTKELVKDDEKRMELWKDHLANFNQREKLCKHFHFGNVDKALENFEETLDVLKKLESLMSHELITIHHEEKTDEEIVSDLKQLKRTSKLDELNETIVFEKERYSKVLELFHEILEILKAELHLIKLIRKETTHKSNSTIVRDVKGHLLKLFELIFQNEARLYKVFEESLFQEENKHIHVEVVRIANAILLEQEIKEEIETDEDKFVKEMAKHMRPEGRESKHKYEELAEDIFDELVEMTGGQIQGLDDDVEKRLNQMEKFVKDDKIMYKVVKKLRKKYDDSKVNVVILAFRKAFDLGDFIDLEERFF